MKLQRNSVDQDHFADFLCVGFSLKLPGFSLSVLPYLGGSDYLR